MKVPWFRNGTEVEWNGVSLSQEEQSGCGSANYDVELIHLSEAHRDVLRGGEMMSLGGVAPHYMHK